MQARANQTGTISLIFFVFVFFSSRAWLREKRGEQSDVLIIGDLSVEIQTPDYYVPIAKKREK